MRRRLLFVALVAVLPAVVSAQEKLVNCRTLEVAGNFVGPDEVIVDDLVCQKAKAGTEAAVKPQAAKPVMGVTISDTATDSVVDAAKAAEKRVADRRAALQVEKNATTPQPSDGANVADTSAAPASAPPVGAAPESSPTAAEPPPARAAEVAASGPGANPAESKPAEPVQAAVAEAPPAPAPPARSRAATPAGPPSQPAGVPSAPAPAPAEKAEQPAPTEIVLPPAPASAASPAAESKTAAPEKAVRAPSASEPAPAEPASSPSSAPPADPARPATSGGFYDANAPKASTNATLQGDTGFASADQVNAGLAPGATSVPPSSRPSATEPEPEPEHTTIAAARVDFDADRDRSIKTGDFAKPREISPDPEAEHRTSVDPSDADGFQDGQRPECTKNISLGSVRAEKLVLGVPAWAAHWIEKNQKRIPEICFSETPMKGARNYLIVFSTSGDGARGKEIGEAALLSAKSGNSGGVGTFTTNYGSTWHYSYDRNVGTTILTRDDADEPHGVPGQVLYATAYTEEGVPVSQRWPGQLKKEINPAPKNSKKDKIQREALEHVSDDLLDQMVEEIQKL